MGAPVGYTRRTLEHGGTIHYERNGLSTIYAVRTSKPVVKRGGGIIFKIEKQPKISKHDVAKNTVRPWEECLTTELWVCKPRRSCKSYIKKTGTD